MTQVSKYRLGPDVLNRVDGLFVKTLARLNNEKELNEFLNDFLSPTEKIVFAKRLAIAVLIAKGNDYAEIGRILKVTPNTIAKMSFHMNYGNGSVKKIADKIVQADYFKALLTDLGGIFDLPTKGKSFARSEYLLRERKKEVVRLEKEI